MNSEKMAIVVALCVFAILGCSKSSTSVVVKCAKEFKVQGLSLFDFDILQNESGAFESPKYHFRLKSGDFSKLEKLLEESGFSNWRSGELSFDGKSFGWDEKDLKYAKIKRNGSTYYAAVSRDERTVIFVRYP